MAIDGVGWDWSFMVNKEENHALVADKEAPTKFALMSKSSSDNEVFDNSLYSKACKKNTDGLNTKITKLSGKLSDTKNTLYHYKLAAFLAVSTLSVLVFVGLSADFTNLIAGLDKMVQDDSPVSATE
nr:hypothetical protein [Tanacetum cinerariifolium]